MEHYFILEYDREKSEFISCENLVSWSILLEMGQILYKTLDPEISNFLSCPTSPLKLAQGTTGQIIVTEYFAKLPKYQKKDILQMLDQETII
jgi:hypothetical protein